MAFYVHPNNKQFRYLAIEFYLGNSGSNCPTGRVVSKEEECSLAADQLGSGYYGTQTNSKRPVGCYSWPSSRQIYFNTIADINATDNIDIRIKGVCSGGMF